MDDKEQQARQRFMLLSMMRFFAVAQVLIGVIILSGRFELPEFIGYIFVVMGAGEFFLVPLALRKSWKQQDGESG